MNAITELIVVPCFNEAARLPSSCFRSRVESNPGTAFLFVDDGSSDQTAERLEELRRQDPERLRVLRLESNRGKAEAVRRGVLEALSSGARFVGYWDADLATPLDEIDHLRRSLEARPEAIGALGSRVQLLGRRIERKAARHYAGRVFATLAGLVLGLPVYDSQCGAKLFRAGEPLRRLFAEPFLSRWIFDVEIISRVIRDHRRGSGPSPETALIEVPLGAWRDVGGSKLRVRHLAGVLVDLARIRRLYR